MIVDITTGIWKNYPTDDSYLLYSSSAFKQLTAMEFEPWAVPGIVIGTADINRIRNLKPDRAVKTLAQLILQAHYQAAESNWKAFYLHKIIDVKGELACSLELPHSNLVNMVNDGDCISKLVMESKDMGNSVTVNHIDGVNCILLVDRSI